ncbi:CDP-diacylglycerol/glycerol-3-phosphate3-phosphatidyltransferase [Desulfurobacterium thermolithotrophum DSM 11699]|uniref:CDP-diacylglycerol--glycerol-3-phosphate 3-phosphatidyltransferase n=1 Tax=Desulfurobacterium thermolithotrophum (strain DSM 11699 / BSA) TaxID=868864 RepID=F0S0D7_DESTD|nr:CDP-diacylglycerol--glycerol-3-phosphate 3-phosphatidyltransferase [Desulfurobacterium thermolithotrophum]ADY72665.1 CDP-diacylglycerol/glycerol-3-phosphate3-phosphatidyltransferase [Desulfurobacterium thermolithotrophum DSM 11699]
MGKVKTIPNFLTLIRIFLLPFVVFSIISKQFFVALVLFVLSAVTDFLDGYIARKQKSITSLGMLLDPVADKLLTSSTLISLAYVKLCDPYSVIAIVGREEAVTGMRAIAASRGLVIPASKGGKIKTTLIMISIILLLSGLKNVGEVFLIVSAGVALYTGFVYFIRFFESFGEEDD